VVTLATGNLSTLPADWASDSFGIETPPSVYDRGWLMMSLAELGRFAEASEPAAEALRLAMATRGAHATDWADINAGKVYVGVLYPSLVASLAWVVAQLGEATEALSLLQEGEQLLQGHCESGYVGLLGWLFLRLGRAALVLGRLDDARRLGDRALEASLNQPGFAAHAHLLLGDIVVHPERFDAEAGEIHFRDALAFAEKLGMRPLVAHSRHGLGKIYRRTGKPDQTRDQFTAATAMYREMGMRFWLEQTEIEMRELH
jgi:tetratricopeptide (TPR) repeat protein